MKKYITLFAFTVIAALVISCGSDDPKPNDNDREIPDNTLRINDTDYTITQAYYLATATQGHIYFATEGVNLVYVNGNDELRGSGKVFRAQVISEDRTTLSVATYPSGDITFSECFDIDGSDWENRDWTSVDGNMTVTKSGTTYTIKLNASSSTTGNEYKVSYNGTLTALRTGEEEGNTANNKLFINDAEYQISFVNHNYMSVARSDDGVKWYTITTYYIYVATDGISLGEANTYGQRSFTGSGHVVVYRLSLQGEPVKLDEPDTSFPSGTWTGESYQVSNGTLTKLADVTASTIVQMPKADDIYTMEFTSTSLDGNHEVKVQYTGGMSIESIRL